MQCLLPKPVCHPFIIFVTFLMVWKAPDLALPLLNSLEE